MAILESRGLPRRKSLTMGEIFKREGFATSATQQKALYVFGLEESMRQKLLKIDGVVDAAVSIALPDRDPLGGDTVDSSASVFIYQAPGAVLRSEEHTSELQSLMRNSYAVFCLNKKLNQH